MQTDIVFLQQHPTVYFGILSLEKHLRSAGYRVEAVIDSLEKDAIQKIKSMRPRLVGISVLSTEHLWLVRISHALKKALPEIKMIVGGVHAMLYPKEIMEETPVDLVCHSDGEEVLVEVMRHLDKPKPEWRSIAGIAFRDAEKIQINSVASLAVYREDLLEDRTVYYRRYPMLAEEPSRGFISTRGCPFHCSFCYNAYLKEHFKGKGVFVRQKEPDVFLKEIALECSRHKVKSIFFFSDFFTFDKDWMRRFLARYKTEVGIPFTCQTMANHFDEETAALLAGAGCWAASFGIEVGNSTIRQNILKKAISDDEIIRCGRLLKKYSIKVQTNNMFCLPGETLNDAFQTVELNIKAGTRYANSALFLPFPKTELTDYCIREGYLSADYSLKNVPHSFLSVSVLDLKDKDSMMNVQRASFFFVRWPWTFKAFRRLVTVPWMTPFFKALSLAGYFLRHKGARRIPFWAMIRFAWRVRKGF
jgi:radical SAM superfamily enzyme YgiQ (UPF0313 family)